MPKRLLAMVATLMLIGFGAAACGGGDSDGTAATDTVTDVVTDVETETDTVTDDETVTEETDTAEGGGAAAPQNLEMVIEQCKKNVEASPRLSEDTKDDLEELCEQAGSGDKEKLREAAAAVCEKVIEDTLPAGAPGREQMLKTCKENTQQR